MRINLREAAPQHQAALDQLHREAYGRADEAEELRQLRAQGRLAFSLIAEYEDQLIGHAAFSPIGLAGQPPEGPPGLALLFFAVHPAHQRRGVGTALLRRAIERLKARRHPFCVVHAELSLPARLGFQPAQELALTSPGSAHSEPLWALPLHPEARALLQGAQLEAQPPGAPA